MNRTHATTHRDVADEDVEQLPFIETLEPEPRHRGEWTTGTSYMSQHDRIRYLFGPAREHRCADCSKPAHHWSLDHYEDAIFDTLIGHWWAKDINRYAPRCARCHRAHDQKLTIKEA